MGVSTVGWAEHGFGSLRRRPSDLRHAPCQRRLALGGVASDDMMTLPPDEATFALNPFIKPLHHSLYVGADMESTDALGYRYMAFCIFQAPPDSVQGISPQARALGTRATRHGKGRPTKHRDGADIRQSGPVSSISLEPVQRPRSRQLEVRRGPRRVRDGRYVQRRGL